MNWPWSALGLDGPSELGDIRRAYAARLKTAHPEEDPEGFQRLHAAYQAACRLVRHGFAAVAEAPPEPLFSAAGEAEEVPAEPETPETPVPFRLVEPETARAPVWDFQKLFAEAEEERRKANIDAWRVRVRRATDLMARAALPFQRRKDANNTARVTALQALYLLEEPDPVGGWELNCRVLLGHESFQTVMNDPLFLRSLALFFQEHPDLPQSVRNAFFREYGFGGRRYIPLRFRRLWNLLSTEQARRKRRVERTGNLLCGLLIILLVSSVMTFFMYHPPWRFQGPEWLEEDFTLDVENGGSQFLYAASGVFFARYGSDGTVIDFLARRDEEQDRAEGDRGYRTNLTGALLSYELERFAEGAGWGITADNYRRLETLERPGVTYLRLPLTGAGEDITALGELLSRLRRTDWYTELPPEYLLNLCWQDWCFYPYSSSDGAFDASAVRAYYEENLGPALCTVLTEETGTAAADLGEGTYTLSELGTVEADGTAYFASMAYGKAAGEPLALYLLSEDGRELFCLPPDTEALSRGLLYAAEPVHRAVNGLADGLDIRDYFGKP